MSMMIINLSKKRKRRRRSLTKKLREREREKKVEEEKKEEKFEMRRLKLNDQVVILVEKAINQIKIKTNDFEINEVFYIQIFFLNNLSCFLFSKFNSLKTTTTIEKKKKQRT